MTALDTRTPVRLDADGMSPDERRQFETLRAHRALGLIVRRVPIGIKLGDLTIRDGCLDMLVGGVRSDHEKRAVVMMLAEQFGFEYTERDHGQGQNKVAATGVYAETSAMFWQLVKPCDCGCAVASC